MKWISWLVGLALLAGAAYYVLVIRQQTPDVATGPVETLPPSESVRPAARPEPETVESPSTPGETGEDPSDYAGDVEPAEEPLPPLENSDPVVRNTVRDWVGEEEATDLLVDEALVSRFVATIDNLTSAQVAGNLLPIQQLGDSLAVAEDPSPPTVITNAQGDELKQYLLSSQNFDRYDSYLAMLDTVDNEALISTFKRYEPLMQEAYADLGYPQATFRTRLQDVISHLLATPDVAGEVRLIKPEAYYEFVDPELESLTAGQKLLVRMGPENSGRVKDRLRQIRALLQD